MFLVYLLKKYILFGLLHLIHVSKLQNLYTEGEGRKIKEQIIYFIEITQFFVKISRVCSRNVFLM